MPVNKVIFVKDFITHDNFGAGNFVYKLYEKGIELDKKLIFLDKPLNVGNSKTYYELSIRDIIDLASKFTVYYKRVGVKAKEPVVLLFEESINYFIQFVALTSIGAIPVFINSLLNSEIIIDFILSTYAKYIITDQKNAGKVNSKNKVSNNLHKIIDISTVDINFNPIFPILYNHHSEDTILLTHTSGTTGIPKAVQFTHGGMFYGVVQQLEKQVGRQILSLLPHSHSSSITMLLSSMLRYVPIKIQTQKKAIDVLKTIEIFKPDMVVSFPNVFVDLCRYDLSQFNLSSINYWLSTGDANHEPHIRKLISYGQHIKDGKKKSGSIFIDNLGSSEFSFAMLRNIHTPYTNRYNRCVGKAFDWVKCAILDDNGNKLGFNKVGYLGVQSKSVTKGYWNNSNLTEKNTLQGYWLTGDLVYQDQNGYYYHVDRITDKIETSVGVFYSCQAEEWILKNLPQIFDISFVGIKDKSSDTHIVSLVELQPQIQEPLPILKKKINALLAACSWPQVKYIEAEKSNTNTGVTGKKLKRNLRTNLKLS